jgi:hypothetical protein
MAMAQSLYDRIINHFGNWLTKEKPPAETPPCDFNRLKYEVRPGDVLLVEGRSRVSNIISMITQSPWTHAALYLGRLHDIEDPVLRKTVAVHLKKRENVRLVIEGILGHGIIVSPLSIYRYHHLRICRPIGIAPNDIEQVIAYSIRALGLPYNVRHLLDLARFLLPWSLLPRRWGSSLFRTTRGEIESGICSSLIAEAFTAVKFPILPFLKIDSDDNNVELIHRNPYLFTPKDFDYSPYFEIIKYPIFDPNQPLPYYRRLPWAKKGKLHQDHGIISEPPSEKKKQRSFFSELLFGKDTTKIQMPESHHDDHKPETD